MADTKVLRRRAHLRQQLTTGATPKGNALSAEKLAELWPEMLDLHIRSERPGRAAALLDVQHMMETGNMRITTGAMESASASVPAAPRKLAEVELSTLETWLAKYRAETPSGAAEIRATEVLFFLCPAATVV